MNSILTLAIAMLVGFLPGIQQPPVTADPIIGNPKPIAKLKPLEPSNLQPQAELQPVYIAPPEPAPQPAAPAAYAPGENTMRDYIFSKESGYRLDAINAGGCIGLGQDCNGWLITGRLDSPACPNWATDLNCQLRYWDWYANTIYGGWGGAYAFRTTHNYW